MRKSNGPLAANGTLYWAMTPGVVAETDLGGATKSEYIFFDGERVARRDGATGTGGVFYYFSDHLKTASIITDSAGVIKAESDYYPWGGELQFVNNDSNDYKFTGKKRDIETGLDYFGARYYSNGLGRWVSADWSPVPVPVPYANFGDPQSLNLYGFVGGNPASKADPDGHADDGTKHDIAKPVPMSNCTVCTGFNRPSNIQSQNDPGVQDQSRAYRFGRWVAETNKKLDKILGPWEKALQNVVEIIAPNPKPLCTPSGCVDFKIGIVFPVGGMGALGGMEGLTYSEIGGGGLRLTESMSKTGLGKLNIDIMVNGLKDRMINYVDIGGEKYIVSGNNRLMAARNLRMTDQLRFQRVDLPFRGFKTEADVINAHADMISHGK